VYLDEVIRTAALSTFFILATACGGKGNSAPPPAEACLAQGNTVEGGGSVAMPAHCTRACQTDDECTVTNVSCPGCCNFQPISRSYADSYTNTKTNDCRAYTGLVCSCDEAPPTSRCVNHMCAIAE